MVQNVFVQPDAGRQFTQREPCGGKLENGPLGHVEHLLTARDRGRSVKTNLLRLPHELRMAPFAHDAQAVVRHRHLQITRAKRTTENQSLGALSDVHESTDAGKAAGE